MSVYKGYAVVKKLGFPILSINMDTFPIQKQFSFIYLEKSANGGCAHY